jgi:cell division protein CrgA
MKMEGELGVPKSKSKRSTYIPPKPAKPKPSPRWVPPLGLGLIILGVVLIIVQYSFTGLLPTGGWTILIGFAVMAGGLGVLSQWR